MKEGVPKKEEKVPELPGLLSEKEMVERIKKLQIEHGELLRLRRIEKEGLMNSKNAEFKNELEDLFREVGEGPNGNTQKEQNKD
ncbi:MAG: hypothetical protein WC609_02485 [Candidatus Paceibacterota bacterium]|jgi:hypothetical protein